MTNLEFSAEVGECQRKYLTRRDILQVLYVTMFSQSALHKNKNITRPTHKLVKMIYVESSCAPL